MAALGRVVKKRPTEEVTCKLRPEEWQGSRQVKSWERKSFWAEETAAEMSLAQSRRLLKTTWQDFGVEREVVEDKFEEVDRRVFLPV